MAGPTPKTDSVSPLVRKSAFRRLLEKRWATLVISLLINAVIILIASLLVVHVVQGRKPLKFTAPPPSAAAKEEEHQVQISKKSKSEGAPNVAKLITSTAANVKIALPPIDISSENPDVMSSVMSGIGGMGLGAGAGAGGAGGGGPSGAMTAFGFKNASSGTLVGTFYDLKENSSEHPINADDASFQVTAEKFVREDFSDFSMSDYYASPTKLYASQWYIPWMDGTEAAKAFQLKQADNYWIIHYQGVVIPKVSGTYRFWGVSDDLLCVQLNHDLVLNYGCTTPANRAFPTEFRLYDGLLSGTHPDQWVSRDQWHHGLLLGVGGGSTFQVTAGQRCPIDIAYGNDYGSTFCYLLIEKVGETYQHDSHGYPILPIFKLAPVPFAKPAWHGPVFAPDTNFSVWSAERPK